MNDALALFFLGAIISIWGTMFSLALIVRNQHRQIAALQADVRALRIAVERVS